MAPLSGALDAQAAPAIHESGRDDELIAFVADLAREYSRNVQRSRDGARIGGQILEHEARRGGRDADPAARGQQADEVRRDRFAQITFPQRAGLIVEWQDGERQAFSLRLANFTVRTNRG